MSADDGTVSELRGFSEPDDVNTFEDAKELFGIEGEVTEDKVSSRFTELTAEYHPDVGGSTRLFQAINKAKEILQGEREPDRGASGSSSDAGTSQSRSQSQRGRSTRQSRGGASASQSDDTGTGFFGDAAERGERSDDFQQLFSIVKTLIEENLEQSEQLQLLVDEFGVDEVAKILSNLIIQGSINLGDVRKMVGSGVDFGDEDFGATDSRFGGYDSRFGRRSRGYDDRFSR